MITLGIAAHKRTDDVPSWMSWTILLDAEAAQATCIGEPA